MIKHNYYDEKKAEPAKAEEKPKLEEKSKSEDKPKGNVIFVGNGAHMIKKSSGEKIMVYFNPEYGKKYYAKDPEIIEILRKKGYKEIK